MAAEACDEVVASAAELRSPGTTLKGERGSGLSASLAPEPGEGIEVYAADSPDGRRWLGIGPDSVCADGVFWFPRRALLLLVELKGSDLEHASAQLETTLRALRARLPGDCPVSFRAVVVLSGSTPRSKPKIVKSFYTRNDCELVVRHATKRRFDLRLVLREADA